jgi:hypothetical protein
MNTATNLTISYKQHQVSRAAEGLIGAVNQQISNAAQLDEQPGLDQAMGAQGSVLSQDQDSFVKLEYNPQTRGADEFNFKAHNDIKAPNGMVVVPKGLETSFAKTDDGVETYTQTAPTTEEASCDRKLRWIPTRKPSPTMSGYSIPSFL